MNKSKQMQFYGFGQATFAFYGAWFGFKLKPISDTAPAASKVVEIDSKIIFLLCYSKFVRISVE